MKLRDLTLEKLANMVVGDHQGFPYRSSYWITAFFTRCEMDYVHSNQTRRIWAKDVLKELNEQPTIDPDLPAEGIVRVIIELLDEDDFDRAEMSRDAALIELNKLLARDHIAAYIDGSGGRFVKNIGTGTASHRAQPTDLPLSKEEKAAREKITEFLKTASEDEFTEKLLVPFFQRHNFRRVSPGGHTEKIMEYGKDMWMKFLLPTGHWIYFCAQIKKGKIDSSGVGGSSNVAEILTQAKMAMDNPIFDPEVNRNVLLDHMYIIASGDITRAARQWIISHLDKEQRRQIIFMDRTEFLEQSARILKDLDLSTPEKVVAKKFEDDDKLPF